MKQYQSVSGKCTVKAYKQNHKFCIKSEFEDGTVLIYQYPTKEQSNKFFSALKNIRKDLVLIK